MRSGRAVAVVTSLIVLDGCGAVSSLRPAVQAASLDYATVFEQFNNQGLLRNILRASDSAPLSFADLPVLHGSLNMQSTLGLSSPFGPIHGGSGLNTFTAGLQFTSNPTFDTSPLNTSGFSLEIIQPISPTFVVAAWQSGISRELLLRLFVESIEFTKSGVRHVVPNKPQCGIRPEEKPGCEIIPGLKATFLSLVERSLKSDLDLRLFTFYLPLGTAAKPKDAKDIVDLATATGESNLHVGNSADGKLEVYRTLPGFALGCLNRNRFNNDEIDIGSGENFNKDFQIAKMPPHSAQATSRHVDATPHHGINGHSAGHFNAESTRRQSDAVPPSEPDNRIEDRFAQITSGYNITSSVVAMMSTPAAGGAAKGGDKSSGGGSKTTPAASQQSVIQPGQISSIVDEKDCLKDTIVLDPDTELEAAEEQKQGIIIHWRSIASVIRYVGAIVAEQGEGGGKNDDSRWSWPSDSGDASREILFSAVKDAPRALVSVKYGDDIRGLQPAIRSDGTRDDSLMVLALLSQLLNDSRIAGDIPTTQRLEIVP